MVKRIWKIFRAIVSVALLLAVCLPAALFVLLSIDPVQSKVKSVAETEISRLLGAEVTIDKVGIHPFNKLDISGVNLVLAPDDTIATVSTVRAGFELYHFLRTGELVIDYALVDGVRLSVSRDFPGGPLNIDPILAHLRSDKPSEEKPFELKINTVIIRDGDLSYDIHSAPLPDSARFDKNHIRISALALNAYIPRLSNKSYQVSLDHLSFAERSGFELSKMQAKVDFSADGARLSDLSVALPHSSLDLMPLSLPYRGFGNLSKALKSRTLHVATTRPGTIYLPDLRAFVPEFEKIRRPLELSLEASGNLTEIQLQRLAVRETSPAITSIMVEGAATHLDCPDSLRFDISRLIVNTSSADLLTMLPPSVPKGTRAILSRLGSMSLRGTATGSLKGGNVDLRYNGDAGNLVADIGYRRPSRYSTSLDAEIELDKVNIGHITANPALGILTGSVAGNGTLGAKPSADLRASISRLDFRGYSFSGITAAVNMFSRDNFELNASITDPAANAMAYAYYTGAGGSHSLRATASLANVAFDTLGLDSRHPGYRFGAKMTMELDGKDLDSAVADISLYDLHWLDRRNKGPRISRINVQTHPDHTPSTIKIHSDVLNGTLEGDYSFVSLPGQLKNMVSTFIPALIPPTETAANEHPNVFDFSFTLPPSPELSSFFGLPVDIIVDATLDGRVDSRAGRADVTLDAPYLRQGSKIIEGTAVYASLDTAIQNSMVYVTTQMPTKKGDMAVAATVHAADNRIDTHVDWTIQRRIPLNGTLGFSALIEGKPDEPGRLSPIEAIVNFNPGTINFGDEVWKIAASKIDIGPDRIDVDKFGLAAGSQSIAIDGCVSHDETDSITIDLDHIALLPIFETLEIEKAMIGGRATGTFTARNLLSSVPELKCPRLHVDSIGYNRCTIGDADVLAMWNNERKSFFLDADIMGPKGNPSKIYGDIYPLGEALDLHFEADDVPVGFLKPFMIAFTSDISGHATGKCHLFGTFKEIDLEGAVYADNVKMKIDFTNTSYTATDSVIMTPGNIRLSNIAITDPEGHTARLNGEVKHKYFKEPVFRFDITDARNLLAFNGTPKQNPDWYGTIYGNGGATISGEPGVVNIKVDMTTGPNSTFTFVLSDRLDAEDYSFMTFRDVTPDSLRVPTGPVDDTPEIVRQLRRDMASAAEEESSDYNMDIQVGITPEARITLVMDPTAGDEIKATGAGNMHLAYNSDNNDLNIWGKYTVNSGSYRFTLQDIIIKDFTIKEGSRIQFDGDPYAVKTDLSAYYATNANLSDLDESFLQDKEVARTNVPVHALMLVSGDIRQPKIDFDLEFPTLTQDTYRKVRSIVSTEDMMNRQIIYLLALNRFYTPDYMSSTTKGSELFSVASSTISSQLGNMLGKLSENWSIAPNLRSDRGDFSDVEVDVALSSRLLNNRLLFNGNFGYRDKALNNNQFIGDFDIEYLLNKRGSWRLKAYNRYNDRNYYLRTAQTTQGIGIMFRTDFDSWK